MFSVTRHQFAFVIVLCTAYFASKHIFSCHDGVIDNATINNKGLKYAKKKIL